MAGDPLLAQLGRIGRELLNVVRSLVGLAREVARLLVELMRRAWQIGVRARQLGFAESAKRTLQLLGIGSGLLACGPGLFVVVTAMSGSEVGSAAARSLIGTATALALPLGVRTLALRIRALPAWLRPASGALFVVVFDTLLLGLLLIGFSGAAGRALRRHGDWLAGQRETSAARSFRALVVFAGDHLEPFDPPPELTSRPLATDERSIRVYGPFREGESPDDAVVWFHPLAGSVRVRPMFESRRFGAARPPPRPVECDLGHCGVDLVAPLGAPVFAVTSGVVEHLERDERRGGTAGRFVRIVHRGGQVSSRYLHLDSIRADLREGSTVRAGETIGRVGRSGVAEAFVHLHFGLSTHAGPAERYVDPEPYLRVWRLP